MSSLRRLQIAATVITTVAAGLAVATTSANAETGCKSGSVISGPAHGWHLQICKSPRNSTTDTFSWTAYNNDSGATTATVYYAVQCTGGPSGWAGVFPSVPATWGGDYSPACAFHAQLNVAGAPGPGGASIVLNLSAG